MFMTEVYQAKDAVSLLDNVITELAKMDIPVLMIAGNHDSAPSDHNLSRFAEPATGTNSEGGRFPLTVMS